MGVMVRRVLPRLKNFLPIVLFAVGFAVLVAGVAQIYTPAAWILAGTGLMAVALL
jgi:hypothetical protein